MQGKNVTWEATQKFSIKEVTTLGSQTMVIILHCQVQLCENGVYPDKKFGHIWKSRKLSEK